MIINVQTHIFQNKHTFLISLKHFLTHLLHTCMRTHTHVLNAPLSIRANGTERLYFIITALILPHLNVSPSIMVTHHFHSNPPKEMNRNLCLSFSRSAPQ